MRLGIIHVANNPTVISTALPTAILTLLFSLQTTQSNPYYCTDLPSAVHPIRYPTDRVGHRQKVDYLQIKGFRRYHGWDESVNMKSQTSDVTDDTGRRAVIEIERVCFPVELLRGPGGQAHIDLRHMWEFLRSFRF